MNNFLNAEAEALIQGYVEGDLTASECARLRALIEASPGLITPILMGLRTDALIRETVLQMANAGLEVASASAMVGVETAELSEPRGDRRNAWAFAIVVGLGVLVVLSAMFFRLSKTPRQTTGIAPPLTGSILYEFWNDISGSALIDFTSHPYFQRAPTGFELLKEFEAPSNRGENYGARVRGYVHPQITGEYVFWIAADDAGELWLSPDENPENKSRICFLDLWVPSHEWTWRPSQQSQPIRLEAGRRYYIEALHKQGTAGDALAVAWQPPGGAREIIPGRVLSPFSQSNSGAVSAPRGVP